MSHADVFVYLDSVPFSKGSYQNRTRIKSPRGPEWLTVPVVTAGRLGQATRDVEIDLRGQWARKHHARLAESYAHLHAWRHLDEALAPAFAQEWTLLAPMAAELNERLRALLDVSTPTVLASELAVGGTASVLLAGICRALGADIYLSGGGGHLYMELEPFRALGIDVRYQQFTQPVYPQPHGEFVPGLSAVDALACDPEAARAAVAKE